MPDRLSALTPPRASPDLLGRCAAQSCHLAGAFLAELGSVDTHGAPGATRGYRGGRRAAITCLVCSTVSTS